MITFFTQSSTCRAAAAAAATATAAAITPPTTCIPLTAPSHRTPPTDRGAAGADRTPPTDRGAAGAARTPPTDRGAAGAATMTPPRGSTTGGVNTLCLGDSAHRRLCHRALRLRSCEVHRAHLVVVLEVRDHDLLSQRALLLPTARRDARLAARVAH
jgi:hypothetical protein